MGLLVHTPQNSAPRGHELRWPLWRVSPSNCAGSHNPWRRHNGAATHGAVYSGFRRHAGIDGCRRLRSAFLRIENNESEKSSRRDCKRHATQVVIVTTNNDTAPNRRRYGTSGGPWPTRGAPLARAGLEPGPGSRSRAPRRRVVSSARPFGTGDPVCSLNLACCFFTATVDDWALFYTGGIRE